MVSSWQRKEAEGTQHKQLWTQTMPMTVLLANTLAQAETLLHGLKWAAAGIGVHVNADKTEYICFNQRGDISRLNSNSLKLVEKFTNLGISVTSTEKDINTWLAKAWTAIDRLSVIWKLAHLEVVHFKKK